MYRQLIVSELRRGLMRLRDPRCHDPHAQVSYLLGLIQGLRIGESVPDTELERVQYLLSNARKHHYAHTPWPEQAEYQPF